MWNLWFLFYFVRYNFLLSLYSSLCKLSQIWPLGVTPSWLRVPLTYPHYFLSVSLLPSTTKYSTCILQFLLFSPGISHIYKKSCVPFFREWCLETKIWAWGLLIGTGCHYFQDFSQRPCSWVRLWLECRDNLLGFAGVLFFFRRYFLVLKFSAFQSYPFCEIFFGFPALVLEELWATWS